MQSHDASGFQEWTCDVQSCQARASLHVTEASQRRCAAERHLCDAHFGGYFENRDWSVWVAEHFPQSKSTFICIDPEMIVFNEVDTNQTIYLREASGHRRIIATIGCFEATAISWLIKGLATPKPLTHDAMARLMESLGGRLLFALVHGLENGIYHVSIGLEQSGRELEVDMRLSDAVALALVCRVPIFATEELLTTYE